MGPSNSKVETKIEGEKMTHGSYPVAAQKRACRSTIQRLLDSRKMPADLCVCVGLFATLLSTDL